MNDQKLKLEKLESEFRKVAESCRNFVLEFTWQDIFGNSSVPLIMRTTLNSGYFELSIKVPPKFLHEKIAITTNEYNALPWHKKILHNFFRIPEWESRYMVYASFTYDGIELIVHNGLLSNGGYKTAARKIYDTFYPWNRFFDFSESDTFWNSQAYLAKEALFGDTQWPPK